MPQAAADENRFACEVLRDRANVDLDRLPAEHVLDLNGTDLAGEVQIAGDELVEAGQRLDRNACVLCDLDDPLPRATRSGRDGDQDLVGRVVAKDPP